MFACAALGFISLGQTFALLLGGIDLSVGPLAGLPRRRRRRSSSSTASRPAIWVLGFVVMLACAVAVGLLNGSLIRFAKFTPVAATLVTYIALGGLAFTLRDAPDGYIAASVTERISTKVGPVPVAFVVFVVVRPRPRARGCAGRASACGCARSARTRSRRGASACRSTGRRCSATSARSLLTFLGAVVLLAQLGVGDPGQGTGYTLTSITAVVLGGTSLLGGRGTFIGTLMGAGLSVQVLNATTFLEPRPEVAVHLPGAPDRRRGAHLQPGAPQRDRAPGQRRSAIGTCDLRASTNLSETSDRAGSRDAPTRVELGPRLRAIRLRQGSACASSRAGSTSRRARSRRSRPARCSPSVRTLYALAVGVRGHGRRGALRRAAPRRTAGGRVRRRPSTPARGPGLAVQRADGTARDHAQLRRDVGAADVLGRRGRRVHRGDLRARRRLEPRRRFVRHSGHEFGLRPQRDAPRGRRLRRVRARGRATRSPSRRRRRTGSATTAAETVRAIWVVRGRARGDAGRRRRSRRRAPA